MSTRKVDIPTDNDELREARNVDDMVDGGDVEIRCSSCNLHLVSVIITQPDAPVVYTTVAECPACQDKSFVTKIMGMIAMAPGENVTITDTLMEPIDGPEDQINMSLHIKTRQR